MSTSLPRRRAIAFGASLMAAAALAEWARPRRTDAARASVPLESVFPADFGAWRIDPTLQAFVRPAEEQGKVYGVYDQVLERAYVEPSGQRIMLSAAYGSEQSPALQLHRPEICYAASGFRIDGQRRERLALAQRSVPVTRLRAVMPGRSEPITYWTVLGDTVAADGDDFRWQQWTQALAGRIRDGLLVRVSSIERDAEAGWRLHDRFARDLLATMADAHRNRVFGAPTG
ncbi:MAG TPA: EpsI family protein [Albitalea sp.]